MTPQQHRIHARCAKAKTQLTAIMVFSLIAITITLAVPTGVLSPAVAVVACLAACTQADGLARTLADIKRHA